MSEVARILSRWDSASTESQGLVVAAIYRELRRQTKQHFANRSEVDLQPPAVVHEAFVRLVQLTRMDLRVRSRFFHLAGHVMRQVLVDEAERWAEEPEGLDHLHLTGEILGVGVPLLEMVSLDELLDRLSQEDPLLVSVVEAQAFAGLTLDESVLELGLQPESARRRWDRAKAFLQGRLDVAFND